MNYENINNRDDLKTQNRVEALKQLAIIPFAFLFICIGAFGIAGGVIVSSAILVLIGGVFSLIGWGGMVWVLANQYHIRNWNNKIQARI